MEKDSRTEILEATLNVLVETGFSNLTFSKIADEADISKSLINYHFETKEDLVLELVDWMIEVTLTDEREKKEGEDREDYLLRILLPEDEEKRKIQRVVLELGTVSPHNEEIAEKFREMHRKFREYLKDTIDGSEDKEPGADFVLSALIGLSFRREVIGEEIDTEKFEKKVKDIIS